MHCAHRDPDRVFLQEPDVIEKDLQSRVNSTPEGFAKLVARQFLCCPCLAQLGFRYETLGMKGFQPGSLPGGLVAHDHQFLDA